MEEIVEYSTTPEERAARRAERTAARLKRQRQRRLRLLKRIAMGGSVCVGLALCIFLGAKTLQGFSDPQARTNPNLSEITAQKPELPNQQAESPTEDTVLPPLPFAVVASENTVTIGEELSSKHAIVIDLTGKTILAQKSANTVVSPASMTKILTLLVAAEQLETAAQLDDTYTIDLSITDYCYVNECSVAGFNRDEAVTVRNLMYGTILPSGAEAALGLANYIAGSHEAFVELMNEKVAELGLSDTAHFTNCVGLYDKRNVCTVYDIAMILRAAMENDLCREVLTTKIYQIPANDEHPDGMTLSNWFLRRIEDYVPDGMRVIGAKTGYVSQAGNCAASIAQTTDGDYYICVTANTTSSKQCIQDHVQLYTTYMGY